MFNKKKKINEQLDLEHPLLFKKIILENNNDVLISKINFYPQNDDWFCHENIMTEKDVKRMVKSMKKFPDFREDDVRTVGTHILAELLINDISLEIDFSKEVIYMHFVDEKKEIFYNVRKSWIEFDVITDVYQFVSEEITSFYKEHRL